MHTLKAHAARLTFLALAVVLTTFAMIPAQPVEAATTCGAWQYNGCCGAYLRQYRQCCDGAGNCTLQTRCNSALRCYF